MPLSSTDRGQIMRDIRQIKAEMKANNVRVVSCFNAGLTPTEYSYNKELFKLMAMLRPGI